MKNENSKNPYIGQTWDEVEKELYSKTEIIICHTKVRFDSIIYRIRTKLGLTQREMSEIIGMKQPMLARLEKGDNDPSLTTAQRMLKPFGLSLAIISDRDEKVIYKFD